MCLIKLAKIIREAEKRELEGEREKESERGSE